MRITGLPGLITLVLCVHATPALAQLETATVVGVITDAQNAVVPGVAVTARNTDTGFARSAVSDAEGRYRLAALPPGPYVMTAELQGFSTSVRRGLTFTAGAEAVINFELVVAGVSDAVTVTADTPVVQTTTAAVEQTINREQIELLPLIGRSYVSLIRLAPGAAANNSSYGFGGSRGRSNTWIIDGVDNSDEISGYGRQNPGIDSIQEVQVLVNGFKAEYGQASGGVVNVVTRSGTNTPSGTGFFVFRNQDLMSASPYANRRLGKDPFRRIHYGGNTGGPLRRDRMHYFVNYEREDRDTFTASTSTYPAATANFSAATRQFFTQYDIDVARFGAGGTVRLTRPEYVDQHKFTARLDTQMSPAQSFTLRYLVDNLDEPSGQSGTLLDYNGGITGVRSDFVTFNHKWILASTMLNEAYVQAGHRDEHIDAVFNRIPRVNVTGGFSLGSTTNFNPVEDWVTQFIDNLTWTLPATRTGEHVVKTGTQIKIFRSDSSFDSNFRGTYTFPSLNAFINGTPSRFTQNQGDSRLKRPNELYAFYLQDDWRPTAALTLNLGVRYDYETARTLALIPVQGRAGPGIGDDRNNVSPRAGFAWAPNGSTGQTMYGGTGIYYDQVILNIIGNARFTPPKVIGIQLDNPGWPDPFSGGTISVPPASVSIIDPELKTPRNWNTQVGYRRELARDVGLDVSLLYNRGSDHVGIINTNLGAPGTANINGGGAVRPDRAFVNKSFYTNYGDIRYKGLLVDLKKRFSHNVQVGANYTLSKTENNAFNFVSGLQVPSQPDVSWGPDPNDRRHRIESHAEIHLPWDLQLGAIVEYRSEAPLDITAARDLNGDGATGDWVNERLCINIQCPGFAYTRNSERELTTEEANRLRSLFGLQPIAAFANNPKYVNADLTLQKRIRLARRQSVRATLEAFNILNTPQRNLPDSSITSSTFGVYTSVDQPRAVQFTLQFDF